MVSLFPAVKLFLVEFHEPYPTPVLRGVEDGFELLRPFPLQDHSHPAWMFVCGKTQSHLSWDSQLLLFSHRIPYPYSAKTSPENSPQKIRRILLEEIKTETSSVNNMSKKCETSQNRSDQGDHFHNRYTSHHGILSHDSIS